MAAWIVTPDDPVELTNKQIAGIRESASSYFEEGNSVYQARVEFLKIAMPHLAKLGRQLDDSAELDRRIIAELQMRENVLPKEKPEAFSFEPLTILVTTAFEYMIVAKSWLKEKLAEASVPGRL